MIIPIAILKRNIATEVTLMHHLHLVTTTRRHTIDVTEQKEKDKNPLMAMESGSGDINAITPTRTTSAPFGMDIKLETHVQSMENHGTGAPLQTHGQSCNQ